MKPTVSVIIPMYGVEQFIGPALESVLAQTYRNFEVILVDDESPDNSVAVCQGYDDPRIRIVRQKNRGLAGARNAGIRAAQGRFLAFLDGDDLWEPTKLAAHVDHLDRDPTVGLSFSPSALIDEHGTPLGAYLRPKLTDITIAELFRGSPIGNGSAPVMRREALDAIRFMDDLHGQPEDCYFDEHFRRAEDIECWLRLAIQTQWRIAGIPEPLTLYRVNAAGLSASLLKQLAAWEQVLAKIADYAPELHRQYGRSSLAYQLRYLARSAVRLRDGHMAVQLINRALTTYPKILLEEPLRTLRTVVLAYLLRFFPAPAFRKIEQWGAKAIARS